MKIFLNAAMLIIIAFLFYLTYSIGHSYGKQEQIIENLTNDYIEIGYTPPIAKHLVLVELGEIPEDSLYTSIMED